MSYKTHRHEDGESYRGVVPAQQPNEGGGLPQEVVEGRPLTKENMAEPNPYRTLRRNLRATRAGPCAGSLRYGLPRLYPR